MDIIDRHDTKKNSLKSHRTNNVRELTLPELATVLERYTDRIKAGFYCPRNSPPNIFSFCSQTSIVIVNVILGLVSMRKQKDQFLIKE